jgi:hypothetical protein
VRVKPQRLIRDHWSHQRKPGAFSKLRCSSEDLDFCKQCSREYSDPFGKPHEQIVENMKALDVIPLLTPEVVDRIEAVVQSKPKRTESYR